MLVFILRPTLLYVRDTVQYKLCVQKLHLRENAPQLQSKQRYYYYLLYHQ